LDEGQRRYAFDNSGLVKVDAIFDPHRPYQLSHSFQRTCEFREAAISRETSAVEVKLRGTDGMPT